MDFLYRTATLSITSKANSTLGFIRRNLKQCPKDLKELAYMSLVRSKLEYAAGTWDPHHEYNINKLKRVQRCAARFECHDFGPRSNVTQMLSDLGWQQLKDRRKHIRLALLFKIIHDIILVPHPDLLLKADSRTRSSHQFKYRTIRTSTDPYKHSFFPRTIPEWNLLHSDTVNSETIDQFKSRLLPPPSSSLRPSAASLELAASVQLAPYCEWQSAPLGSHTPPGGYTEYSSRQDKTRQDRTWNNQVQAEAELRARQGFRGWARIRSRAETTDHSRKLASAIVCRWRRSGHVTRSSAWLIPHILLK